ncbi:Fe-S-cluster-containing hydrogenase component 2 [Desulfocicer vacuolatum DSM 3385]|uniref:Fe-S-cluster-containing hydrogenase component 2 n=1 Tax=Desulfocicer vacuolatum DSM 3385 TaxID=1121400 RepID=A0A1W2AVP5_9BACT|nr:4Fe-4S binding protein [Desulfocicer vacuolatum]SMC64779.1 Fe-S-cluster-containing hydrogenase component 2 [Desulfocicer vacuolatum DSM 3385]
MGLIFNNETCSGCKACELVCTLQNLKEINPSKAMLHVYGKFPDPGKYYVDICDQCGACAEACPQDAIELKGQTYRINKDKCDKCMACVPACPVNLVKVDDDGYPYKCINCKQCVTVCPRDALTFE